MMTVIELLLGLLYSNSVRQNIAMSCYLINNINILERGGLG